MRCNEQVYIKGSNVPRFKQCKHEAVIGDKCHIHSTAAIAKRQALKEQRFMEKINRDVKLEIARLKLKQNK